MNNLKAVYLVTVVATILGFASLILAAAELRIAAHNVEVARALSPHMDSKVPKVDAQSIEVEGLLRFQQVQQEEVASLRRALLRSTKGRQTSALYDSIAWGVLCALLSLLTILLKPART